jgi:hypothetical protein
MAQSKKKPAPVKPKPVSILPLDSITQKVTYSGTVVLEGRSKDNIYKRIQAFVADPAKIIKDDKTGLYKYKGSIAVNYPSPTIGITHKGTVDYVVTFTYADGTYTYIITDFVHSSQSANGGHLESKFPECDRYILTPAGWGAIKQQTKEASEKLVETILTTMRMP